MVVLFLLWAFLLCCFAMRNMDIWWHLRTGQLIWQRGEVPQVDWYTYTDSGKPWIDLHWGFQVLVAGLHALGGVSLLILTKALITSSAVAVAWTAGGRGFPAWTKVLLWLPAVIVISGRSYVRPEMLSLFFLAAWFLVLDRMRERPRLIWLLPLIQILWINCHALFVLGVVVGAAYAVDFAVRSWCRGRFGLEPISARQSGTTLTIVSLLVLLAAVVNPYFERGALFPLELYRKFSVDQEFYGQRIGEFQQPIDFIRQFGLTNIYLQAQVALWVMTAASFVWLGFHRRWSLMRLLLFIAFSHLAWEASRNSNLFAIVSGTLLCGNCRDAIALRYGEKGGSEWFGHRLCTQGTVVGVVCLLLSVIGGVWAQYGGEGNTLDLGTPDDYYMHDAAKFAGQKGFPTSAFVANFGQAAVYAYHNAPNRKVFMDGRLEVCTRKTYEQFELARKLLLEGDRRFVELIRGPDGRVPAILLDRRSAPVEIYALHQMPEAWRLVFADGTGAVFLDVPTADRLGLPDADPTPLLQPLKN